MSAFGNLFDAMDRLITEHGSAAILREHLGLLKAKLAEQEAENTSLQAQVKDLQARALQEERRAREVESQLQALTQG